MYLSSSERSFEACKHFVKSPSSPISSSPLRIIGRTFSSISSIAFTLFSGSFFVFIYELILRLKFRTPNPLAPAPQVDE